MKKEINCVRCSGTGKEEIDVCDECGAGGYTSKYKGKQICICCWSEKLTLEEIQ